MSVYGMRVPSKGVVHKTQWAGARAGQAQLEILTNSTSCACPWFASRAKHGRAVCLRTAAIAACFGLYGLSTAHFGKTYMYL